MEVVGFVQMLTDGEIQAYLCNLVVRARSRRRRIGETLVREAFAASGARRMDVLALDGSEGFYEAFRHRRFAGYRIYPDQDKRVN